MPKPCELVKSVDLKTRTVYLKPVKQAAFMSFNNPGHCTVCRRAKKVILADEPHKTVRAE